MYYYNFNLFVVLCLIALAMINNLTIYISLGITSIYNQWYLLVYYHGNLAILPMHRKDFIGRDET